MDNSNNKFTQYAGIISVIIIATILRLIPHPVNFSPITAMALFSGVYIARRSLALGIPLVVLLLSDLFLGFHDQMLAVYLPFALVTCLGFIVAPRIRSTGATTPIGVGLLSISGSLLFFISSNFFVWLQSGMYPRNFAGLVTCFISALPFLQNEFAGDLFYSTVLFGAWALMEKAVPRLRVA